MADSNDDASGMTGDAEAGGATGVRAKAPTSVVAEFVDAVRSAAESLLEERKRQVAERVGGIAEALHSAAHSLEHSQNTLIARYVGDTADRVEDFSRQVRDRRWNEIVSDTEDFARRQPTLFVLGAMATGFLVGRFLWARTSEQRQASEVARELSQRETASNVTAAVSSASGTGVGEAAGDGLTPSGAREPS
jgi:ElaB/YqjD/DUF883 family membrane-anchored ribosome-binding protein